jgi:hypothetical protein
MIVVCWEMNRSVWTSDFVVVLESMIVQYSAPGVCQTRVPYRMLGVRVASKYEVLVILGQCRGPWTRSGQLGGAYTAPIVRFSLLVGIFTVVTSSVVTCGRFALL